MSASPKPDPKNRVAVINPGFNFILVVNVFVVFANLSVMVWAASGNANDQSELRKDLFTTCKYAFVSGVSLFVGLAGGRAASPDSRK
jgi:hypothetical protein